MYDENKPYLVMWEATQSGAKAHPLELDISEAREMIDQVARLQPDTFLVTGSDPLKRPDIVELIAYAAGQGLRVTMSCSATQRLAVADFHGLKAAGLRQISLSLNRATCSNAEPDGNCTMVVVRKVHEAGLPLQVYTTFTRLNFIQFDALVAQVDAIRPQRWSVFQDVPCLMDGNEPLTAQEGEELSRRLARLAEQVPYEIKTTESSAGLDKVIKASSSNRTDGMIEGRGFLFISHVGGLRPSSFHPITAGNIRLCDLLELYRRLNRIQKGIGSPPSTNTPEPAVAVRSPRHADTLMEPAPA